MDKLISIDDERLWSILFDEACIEGQQADRIYKALEEIAQPAFDKEKVIDQLKVLSSRIILNTNISDDYAEGYVRAAKDIIEIIEKGGIK